MLTLTFEADCGSIKGAGVSAEEGSEQYLPWYGEYTTNLIIANVETLSHNDSNSHSFSSDGHEFGAMVLWPSLDPPLLYGVDCGMDLTEHRTLWIQASRDASASSNSRSYCYGEVEHNIV